jgi:hypothetical protein
MATNTPHSHATPAAAAAGHALHGNEHPEMHEHSDVSIKGLVVTIVLFVVVGVLTHVMLYYLFWFLEAQQAKKDLPRSSLTGAAANMTTPEPRVQGIPGYHAGTPAEDTVVMKQDVQQTLRSYGPTPVPGLVHIPIARAMELSLEQNVFKTRPTTQPAGAATHASH